MKRCPQCNHVETDQALKFCRVDGATLVAESPATGSEFGTGGLGSSPDEVHTSILPHRTDAGMRRATGTTTTLPSPTPEPTGALAKPKSRKAIVIAVVVTAVFAAVTAIVVNSYLSRKSGTAITSIAVMPFVNDNGNLDLEYLSDGMTETLISSLSQLPNLNVKPRSTVFRYKGKDTNPQSIGKVLNVQAVLNGRVIQRGEDVSLFVELIDVAMDKVVWSQQYNRQQKDLITLQTDIARDVSSRLKNKLSGADEAKITKTSTTNPEAYQAYLKGRYYWNRRTAENLRKAIEQFKAATDRDPNYALAFSGLADCYALLTDYAGTPVSETAPQAKAFAERAITIDDRLAEPHATLGIINMQLFQWRDAEKESKLAVDLNPTYPTGLQWYGSILMDTGKYDEAAVIIKRASELDPLSGAISNAVTNIYQLQSNYQAAIENSLKFIELDPTFPASYRDLGFSYSKLGRHDEAILQLEKAALLGNRASWLLGDLGYVYAVGGKRNEALAIIRDLEAQYARKQTAARYLAAVYAGLGDKDKAMEWLEKDLQNKNGRLTEVRWTIPFESLHDDPRFKDIFRRMGLPN